MSKRQDILIETNLQWLRQALDLMMLLDDDTYRCPTPIFPSHRVGGHLRHVLEFYECFLDGLDSSHIDYDARKRNLSVENSRIAAMSSIRALMDRLQNNPLIRSDSILWVRMEDCDEREIGDRYLTSSPGRELQALSSHTIHHFALISMILAALGVAIAPDFGVAPSTLRYRASSAEAA